MDPLIVLALLLICLPLGYLAWSLLSADKKGQTAARDRLARGSHRADEADKKAGTGFIEKIGYRLTPAAYVLKLDHLLSLAGRPANRKARRRNASENHDFGRSVPNSRRRIHLNGGTSACGR